MKERVLDLVFAAVDEINADMPAAMRVGKRQDAALAGTGRKIYSLGLVMLLSLIETRVAEAFGKRLSLGDERMMAEDANPLATIGGLAAYLVSRLDGGGAAEVAVPGPAAGPPLAVITATATPDQSKPAATGPKRQRAPAVTGATLEPILFIGATPFLEQHDIVSDINAVSPRFTIEGILEDNPELHGTTIEGVPVLGPLDMVGEHSGRRLVMGIGTYASRHTLPRVVERLDLADDRYVTLIHPSAKVYSSATVGNGAIVHAGCVIGNGTVIGPFVKVIWNAVIGRDNLIGRGTSVCPLATTGKCVRVGPYGFLGSSSAIADDLTLGPMVAVAMNALLTRDVGPGMFVFGNPARILGRDTVPAPLIEDWEKQLRDFPPAALEEGAGRAQNGGAT